MGVFVTIFVILFLIVGIVDICLMIAKSKLKHKEFWEGFDETDEQCQ